MKRVIVYDVETKKLDSKSEIKSDKSLNEKKQRAIRTIHNASTLSKIVKSIERLKLTDPSNDGPVIKEAIEKISSIVEEMKSEFKKDYWD
jgi:hypothetical protein